MFLELEGRVKLYPRVSYACDKLEDELTSASGINGGPAAISVAFVPGRMRRPAFASIPDCSIEKSGCKESCRDGEGGAFWISAGGGGLGSRGECGGTRDIVSSVSSVPSTLNMGLGRVVLFDL